MAFAYHFVVVGQLLCFYEAVDSYSYTYSVQVQEPAPTTTAYAMVLTSLLLLLRSLLKLPLQSTTHTCFMTSWRRDCSARLTYKVCELLLSLLSAILAGS